MYRQGSNQVSGMSTVTKPSIRENDAKVLRGALKDTQKAGDRHRTRHKTQNNPVATKGAILTGVMKSVANEARATLYALQNVRHSDMRVDTFSSKEHKKTVDKAKTVCFKRTPNGVKVETSLRIDKGSNPFKAFLKKIVRHFQYGAVRVCATANYRGSAKSLDLKNLSYKDIDALNAIVKALSSNPVISRNIGPRGGKFTKDGTVNSCSLIIDNSVIESLGKDETIEMRFYYEIDNFSKVRVKTKEASQNNTSEGMEDFSYASERKFQVQTTSSKWNDLLLVFDVLKGSAESSIRGISGVCNKHLKDLAKMQLENTKAHPNVVAERERFEDYAQKFEDAANDISNISIQRNEKVEDIGDTMKRIGEIVQSVMSLSKSVQDETKKDLEDEMKDMDVLFDLVKNTIKAIGGDGGVPQDLPLEIGSDLDAEREISRDIEDEESDIKEEREANLMAEDASRSARDDDGTVNIADVG